MAYEEELILCAKAAINRHGKLKEVLFIQGNDDSILVFKDGTMIPILWRKYNYDIMKETYLIELSQREGAFLNPFSLLKFGYSGSGPRQYSVYLDAAGFKKTDLKDISPPQKLTSGGEIIQGIKKGNIIEWEDGSVTNVDRIIGA